MFGSELQNPKAGAKECEARDMVVSTLDAETAAEEAIGLPDPFPAGRCARWRPLPSFYLLGMGFRWPCPHLLRIQVTICQRGWTGTVRPAREVTDTDLGI